MAHAKHVGRRRALSAGVAALVALVVPAGRGHAFTVRPATPAEEQAIREACGSPAYHAELLDAVLEELSGKGVDVSRAEVRALVAQVTSCPICGCPLQENAS